MVCPCPGPNCLSCVDSLITSYSYVESLYYGALKFKFTHTLLYPHHGSYTTSILIQTICVSSVVCRWRGNYSDTHMYIHTALDLETCDLN